MYIFLKWFSQQIKRHLEQTFSDGEALPCRVGVHTVHSGLIRPGCLLEGSFPATAIEFIPPLIMIFVKQII
jgi:hypothetical protein